VIRALLIIAMVVATTGMSCSRWLGRQGIPAQCEPIGFQECKSTVRWEGDPEDAATWDLLGEEVLPAARAETRSCEVRRKALEQCLRRLDKAGVIELEAR